MHRSIRWALSAALACTLAFAAVPSAIAAPEKGPGTARSSPAWIKDGVIYEIFPRAFSAKGDFNGITARLDDLQKLGVNILWLMPIHPLGREKAKGTIGSPYAVRDFYGINPDYGTKEDLKRLVGEAHKRNLKVVIDIVANHTSWDNTLLKQHPDFYTRDAQGKVIPPDPDWADVADLDYGNPALRVWMVDMLKHWLKDYGLDGFRCDVAWGVPRDFWESARVELERVKPDLLMLAESELPELLLKAFDVDYSWELHHQLQKVLHGEAPASSISKVWQDNRARYPAGSLRMRFSDNHDERRAIARFGEKGALAAAALAFTLDGVPMLYNGMEAGDTTESGAPALFEKMPVFWAAAERRPEFPRTFRELIALRKAHPALRQGELEWARNSDDARVLTFLRRGAGEEILVAINLTGLRFAGAVELPNAAAFSEIPVGAPGGKASLPSLWLEPWGFRVFRRPVR